MKTNFEPIKRTKPTHSDTSYTRSQAKKLVKLKRQQARHDKHTIRAAGEL